MTAKTKKAGRPVGTTLPPELKKGRMFSIKITDQEHQALKALAKKKGTTITQLILSSTIYQKAL